MTNSATIYIIDFVGKLRNWRFMVLHENVVDGFGHHILESPFAIEGNLFQGLPGLWTGPHEDAASSVRLTAPTASFRHLDWGQDCRSRFAGSHDGRIV